MSLRKADGPLTVQLPSPGQDRPSWLGVGAVAVAGFVIGVAWPRLAGVRLGPSVPDSPVASASAVESPAAGAVSPSATPVALSSPAKPSSPLAPSSLTPSVAAPASPGLRVSVGHGAILSCRTASDESLKGGDCGAVPGLDGVVLPRLRKLADCPDVGGASGKVHLVVRVDFARDALAVDLGHDHGVANAGALLACVKSALASASLDGIVHDHPRYSVGYAVTIPSSASEPAAAAAPVAVADAVAQVEWDVAIVRDAPKTGKVLARLQRGTPLHVGASKDGWYPVKYGDGFASDGWVYRGAIGR